MNKEDILAKSRKENKDKDLFEAEVNTNAATIGSITASLLATVFFLVQFFIKSEWNLALYAVVLAIGTSTFTCRAVFLKRKRDMALTVLFGAATIILTIIHFYKMIVG